ncbi:MAG: 30S ribosome-binding factor RbfA [Alphaproteobacteria bacterium]|nr:30S ribosome-binding factor RbfA [Alphaproteobacteria bacterium]
MPKKTTDSNRNDRIASKVQTIVAEILRDEYADDEILSGVSLVGAVAHGGLQFVKLFFYCRANDTDAAQRRLDDETKTIRFLMGQKIDQKYVPQIKFVYDDTLERAAKIDELLNNLK